MSDPSTRGDELVPTTGERGGIVLEGKRVVLLLQGGGALGAYQVGAHEALCAECERQGARVHWVGGISIGAINAAVIAGPKCGDARVELRSLWDDLLSPRYPPFDSGGLWRVIAPVAWPFRLEGLAPRWWSWIWLAYNPFGKRHFFTSRVVNPLRNPWIQQWLRPLRRDELGFYGTEPLRRTLDRHVDWESIDRRDGDGQLVGPRLSLGATRVTTGEVVVFDNHSGRRLGADHVLASGALPPAFPPIRVRDPGLDDGLPDDDAAYWDGGVSSNTPIQWLVRDLMKGDPDRDTIVFLLDLWDRSGPLPRSMDEVCWRQKSIQYGSRKQDAEAVVREHHHRLRLGLAANARRLEVYHLMYERSDADGPQFAFGDADFSRATFERMCANGREDMEAALRSPETVRVVDPAHHDHRAVLYCYGTVHKGRERARWREHAAAQGPTASRRASG